MFTPRGLSEGLTKLLRPISITLDTYSHVLPNMQQEAVKAMEDLID